MKNVLIMPIALSIVLALSGSLYAQKVKSVEFKNMELLPDDPKKGLVVTKQELKEFDEEGRLTKQELKLINPAGVLMPNSLNLKEWKEYFHTEEITTYDEMGDMVTTSKSYYSTKSNLRIKEEYTDHLKYPGMMFTKTYKYTAAGKPDGTILTNKDDRKVGDETYKYNSDNEETYYKRSEVFPDGTKYTEVKKTSYTNEGFLASSESFIKEGDDVYKEIITFNRNKVTEHIKFKNGEQISSFGGVKAQYDPSKARVLMEFGNSNSSFGGLWSSEDELDDKGRKTKTIQREGDEIIQTTLYVYDKAGNLTETNKKSFKHGKETNTHKETLAYDKSKNIIKKELYENNKLISQYTYDYKYY